MEQFRKSLTTQTEAGKVESYFRYYVSTNQYTYKYKTILSKSISSGQCRQTDSRQMLFFSILCSVKTIMLN